MIDYVGCVVFHSKRIFCMAYSIEGMPPQDIDASTKLIKLSVSCSLSVYLFVAKFWVCMLNYNLVSSHSTSVKKNTLFQYFQIKTSVSPSKSYKSSILGHPQLFFVSVLQKTSCTSKNYRLSCPQFWQNFSSRVQGISPWFRS